MPKNSVYAGVGLAIWLGLMVSRSMAQEVDDSQPLISAHLNVTTNSGEFTWIDVNLLLGAPRFYDAGYFGTRTRIANIEAEHFAVTHTTLEHYSSDPVTFTGTGAVGSTGSHATEVAHLIAGKNALGTPVFGKDGNLTRRGMAPDAQLWSGAIATDVGGDGSFSTTSASVASTYLAILVDGFSASDNQKADVFNSSWGFSANGPTQQQILAGYHRYTVGVDGLINRTGTVGVIAAGNEGENRNGTSRSNSVDFGAGYNAITVGALGTDTSDPVFGSRSSFSSHGPSNFWLATGPNTGSIVSASGTRRATVDISAPGQNLITAAHDTVDGYWADSAGTSLAAPLVAGGASLIIDAGKDLYGSEAASDGRVVKAVLLNGASKTSGWSNGQSSVNGVIRTDRSLDYQVGAGRMDLSKTFDNYVLTEAGGRAGTADVPDLLAGNQGNVAPVGWDLGQVQFQAGANSNFYYIDSILQEESLFTATLTWFADRNSGASADFSGFGEQHLANLDLSIFQFGGPDDLTRTTIAESFSLYNVVEHLHFLLPSEGHYGIEVTRTGSHWNFTGEVAETYGLAWNSVAVPEPSSLLGAIGLLGVLALQRRSPNRGCGPARRPPRRNHPARPSDRGGPKERSSE